MTAAAQIIDETTAPHAWIDNGWAPERSILVTAVTATGAIAGGARFYAPHRKLEAFTYAGDLARNLTTAGGGGGVSVRVSRATSHPTH